MPPTRREIEEQVIDIFSGVFSIPTHEVDLDKKIADYRSGVHGVGPGRLELDFLKAGFAVLIEKMAQEEEAIISEEDAAMMVTGEDWVQYLCGRLGVV